MQPETRQIIYDEICRTLTYYEEEFEIYASDPKTQKPDYQHRLYCLLVKIQNHWEDTITNQD